MRVMSWLLPMPGQRLNEQGIENGEERTRK
jgi:hypothetical protein